MKILVINYEYPPLGGGSSTATKNLAKEFVKQGHEVSVLTSRYKGQRKKEFSEGINIYRLSSFRRSLEKSDPLQMSCFVASAILKSRLISKIKPDVCLAFFSIPCGIFALWIKRLYKIDYVLTLRGGDVPGFLPEELKNWHRLTNPLNKIIWKNAKALNTNSPHLFSLAKEFMDVELEIIPNGVDTEFFSPLEKKSVEADIIRLLFVGRLTIQKNLELLLKALKRSKKQFKLTIVGDGPEKENILKSAEGLNYDFKGWIKREDLARIYQSNDYFILPSLAEGMSNSLLEALACGLPAIVSSEGEHQVVKNNFNGYTFKSNSLEELVGILDNLDLGNIEVLRRNAQETALKYNWEEAARAFLIQLEK